MSAKAELIFGVGVPASAGAGDDPVGRAGAAERLGYDFVSAADHPCGPDPSYETATMLTWIAARTSRIKVASRVLAVPFRRPARVAKRAASLDLLSGGRFILGLGAGYVDEEIVALGGPALSPAEKIDGLAEAIQVIRGGWTRSGYTQQGRQYSVRDLELEPKPGRPIPIWLGAFGPRALAVTGRLADGWIPSLGYLPTEQFPALRRRIDAAAAPAGRDPATPPAAEPAGRDPAHIRSILNLPVRIDPAATPHPDLVTGSASQVAAQLHDLVTRYGFTGFHFMLPRPQPQQGPQQTA